MGCHFLLHRSSTDTKWISQVALVVKTLPTSAGDLGDTGSIPGLGRSPGEGHGKATPVFFPGESGESGRLRPCGRKESDTVEVTEHIDTWGGGNDLIPSE